MPIPFHFKLKRVPGEIRLKNNMAGNSTEWMAWWYCGFYKNQLAKSQPNVLVAFREFSSGMLSDNFILRRVPLTSLGQVRIGTVWKDSMCRYKAVFDEKKFSVDFTKNAWKFTSFQKTNRDGAPAPYPQDIYPLQYEKDKNWFIEFPLSTGGKLVVPCIEFFSRCYGRSGELKRILATYPWPEGKDAHKSRLYAPIEEQEEPNKWKVKLRRRLVNGDIVLLAHAKYDQYTEQAVKSIYAQIETLHDPENKKPSFIEVAPWFQGSAELKVKGIWFDNKRSFLGLQVIGCSNPDGVTILRDRENTNKTDLPAEAGVTDEAWAGAPERVLVKPPTIIDLTGDEEPDHGAGTIEIQDPDFEILGQARAIIDVRKERAEKSKGKKSQGTDASEFSSGEPYGAEKGVGYAAIHAKPVMESQGILRDMWNALLLLRKKYPELIQSVGWYTFEHGFRFDAEPSLIGLQPFDEEANAEIDTDVRHWPYYDLASLIPRGILVIRVIVKENPLYLLEIQRRPRKKKTKDGTIRDAEESYKGLVFALDNQSHLQKWLRQLLADLRDVKGVVQKIAGTCPGKAATFKHTPASKEEVPCEAAAMNALKKMGVEV